MSGCTWRDTVDDAEAPATVPPPDDTDDPFVSPFTGAPGTGFGGASLIPAPVQAQPKFNQRVFAYIGSLPRGEQDKAKRALFKNSEMSVRQPVSPLPRALVTTVW